jgi:hypothetical protein
VNFVRSQDFGKSTLESWNSVTSLSEHTLKPRCYLELGGIQDLWAETPKYFYTNGGQIVSFGFAFKIGKGPKLSCRNTGKISIVFRDRF